MFRQVRGQHGCDASHPPPPARARRRRSRRERSGPARACARARRAARDVALAAPALRAAHRPAGRAGRLRARRAALARGRARPRFGARPRAGWTLDRLGADGPWSRRVGDGPGMDRLGLRGGAASGPSRARTGADGGEDVRRTRGPAGACVGARDAGRSGDHPAVGVGRGQAAHARRAVLRGGRARLRPPHGHGERLRAGRFAGDRARDREVPHRLQWLERHRLQLPRRPLRAAVRGARGRDRQGRDRGPGAGLQLLVDRDLEHRDVHGRTPDPRGHRLPVAADRVEARLARRAGDGRGDRRLQRRRGQPLSERAARHASAHLRPSRRRLDRVPGQHALRAAAGDPRAGGW